MPAAEYYLTERAKFLARMYLTRRWDFHFLATPASGADYLIDLTNRGRQTGRIFGLQIKAAADRSALIRPDGRLRSRATGGARQFLENVPYPVGVFAIVVKEPDESFFGWLKTRAATGEPLELEPHPMLSPLDAKGIDQIAAEVTAAYQRS